MHAFLFRELQFETEIYKYLHTRRKVVDEAFVFVAALFCNAE